MAGEFGSSHPMGGPSVQDEWVAIDFETASKRATPCQVGAVRMRDGGEVDALSTLVYQRPEDFNPFNVHLHGIRPEMVADAPPWPAVRTQLLAFSAGVPLVAHNAPFDMGVIRDASDLNGLGWPTVQYACTLRIARQTWPGLRSYSLSLLCEELGVAPRNGQFHDAFHDARLSASLLLRAFDDRGTRSLADLLGGLSSAFGQFSSDGWHGSRLRTAMGLAATDATANPDADPDSPLFGKVVAFTGELIMPRREAWLLVATAGGQPAANVTKVTDFLVCGYQDLLRLATDQEKSGKLRKAEALHHAGQPIEFLTERDFFQMLDS
jgi:DNA polymerase III epsilon subunit-like protein